jgi:hypothetical protein
VLKRDPAAQIVEWLDGERGTVARQVTIIDIVAGHRVIHIAITLQDRAGQTQGCFFAERQVDHALGFEGVVVAIGELGIGLEFAQHRLGGDQVEHAARGVPSVQGPLGAPQHLDPFNIIEFSFEETVCRQRHIVLVDADPRIARLGDHVSTDAADLEVEACEVALGEGHVRDGFDEVRTTGQLQALKRTLVKGGNGDWNILDGFLDLLGRHRHGRKCSGALVFLSHCGRCQQAHCKH